MQGYRLSKEAQDDLQNIKSYTLMTWGIDILPHLKEGDS